MSETAGSELARVEVEARKENVAAFFDLDGTLLRGPSLEKRFFRTLRYRGEIGFGNYCAWIGHAGRLLRRGIAQSLQGNKMYLRGVSCERGMEKGWLPKPAFFEEGLEMVAWHTRKGHAIVLVTGTLDFLANYAAELLKAELRKFGLETRVRVCATRIEAIDGRWTGHLDGAALFGREKGYRVQEVANELRVELKNCFAYGNSEWDRWMLAMAGNAVAVNPAKELERIAEFQRWPVLHWNEKSTASEQALNGKKQRVMKAENLG